MISSRRKEIIAAFIVILTTGGLWNVRLVTWFLTAQKVNTVITVFNSILLNQSLPTRSKLNFYYLLQECQVADWKNHKTACKRYSKSETQNVYDELLKVMAAGFDNEV